VKVLLQNNTMKINAISVAGYDEWKEASG